MNRLPKIGDKFYSKLAGTEVVRVSPAEAEKLWVAGVPILLSTNFNELDSWETLFALNEKDDGFKTFETAYDSAKHFMCGSVKSEYLHLFVESKYLGLL